MFSDSLAYGRASGLGNPTMATLRNGHGLAKNGLGSLTMTTLRNAMDMVLQKVCVDQQAGWEALVYLKAAAMQMQITPVACQRKQRTINEA